MAHAIFQSWSTESRVFVVGMLLTVTCYFAHGWLSSAAPDDSTIPVSATMALTESLLGEAQAPHPVGSPENKAVKQRIVSWLTALPVSLQPEKQPFPAPCGYRRCRPKPDAR